MYTMAESPLAQLFAEQKIRFSGDADAPLLCAIDVANFIEDNNYNRIIKSYEKPKYLVYRLVSGVKQSARVMFLTECGVYKYLLQSKRPKAEEFQEFVFHTLAKERKRVVDDQKLSAKIKLDEQLLRNEVLLRENSELKVSVQGYRAKWRTADWLLTRSAVELEKGFKKPDAQWTDLAVYYIKRFNREMEKKVLDTDPAQLDYRLQRIVREAFAEPLMHYDGYAVFVKRAQELEEELKRGGKKERVYTIADVDPAVFAANLKLVRESRLRQEAEAAEAARQRARAKKISS